MLSKSEHDFISGGIFLYCLLMLASENLLPIRRHARGIGSLPDSAGRHSGPHIEKHPPRERQVSDSEGDCCLWMRFDAGLPALFIRGAERPDGRLILRSPAKISTR